MNSFTIRKATVDDAAGVANVKYHSWRDTYRGIVSDSFLDAMSVDELTTIWQKILSPVNIHNITNVLVSGQGEVVGFQSHAKKREEQLNTDGTIMALYLLKEYRAKGLGAQLFKEGIVQLNAMGIHSFYLNVLTQNPSLNFYRKFKPQKEIPIKAKIGELEYDELTLVWTDLDAILKQA